MRRLFGLLTMESVNRSLVGCYITHAPLCSRSRYLVEVTHSPLVSSCVKAPLSSRQYSLSTYLHINFVVLGIYILKLIVHAQRPASCHSKLNCHPWVTKFWSSSNLWYLLTYDNCRSLDKLPVVVESSVKCVMAGQIFCTNHGYKFFWNLLILFTQDTYSGFQLLGMHFAFVFLEFWAWCQKDSFTKILAFKLVSLPSVQDWSLQCPSNAI